jgi:hypothetical protein
MSPHFSAGSQAGAWEPANQQFLQYVASGTLIEAFESPQAAEVTGDSLEVSAHLVQSVILVVSVLGLLGQIPEQGRLVLHRFRQVEQEAEARPMRPSSRFLRR